jgi:hypothetical protein
MDSPETSVRNYHYSLCNNTEEGSYHLFRSGSPKSRIKRYMFRHTRIIIRRKHVRAVGLIRVFNPLNAELNPPCHLLALLGAHHILHVSRIRVSTLFHMKISLLYNFPVLQL